MSRRFRDEDVLTRAGLDERLGRDHEARGRRQLEGRVPVHAGPQLHAARARLVGELEAHAQRARRRIQHRRDELDAARKALAGIGGQLEDGLLAHANACGVLLEDVGEEPHLGEIGDFEERRAGRDRGAGDDVPRRHVPVDG